MEYLRIEEDGELKTVTGIDPTADNDLLEELDSDMVQIVRYHGNRFEALVITDVADGPEEDDPREFTTRWEEIQAAK